MTMWACLVAVLPPVAPELHELRLHRTKHRHPIIQRLTLCNLLVNDFDWVKYPPAKVASGDTLLMSLSAIRIGRRRAGDFVAIV